jgi:hypothetical protein
MVDIDIAFRMSADSNGKDPDTHSKTLKGYHKFLWSKELPSGELFHLEEGVAKRYLTFRGIAGEHFLSSDSIGNSFSYHRGKQFSSVLSQINPSLLKEFREINLTIGGFILFPGNKIDGRATINGSRGLNHKIADRFDLTLECIRRHYLSMDSPLREVLDRYGNFFDLFIDFRSYVDFFHLNDLVSSDCSKIRFFIPSEPLFESSGLPSDVAHYLEYRANSMNFVRLRNLRLSNWAVNQKSQSAL